MHRPISPHSAFAILLFYLCPLTSALCPLPPARAEEKESAWQKLFREHASGYKIALGENADLQATGELAAVRPNPVLFWTQPVRGGDDGAVYLWTHGGRAVAIGTFFIWPLPEGGNGVSHELHTLAAEGLTAQWERRRWNAPADSIRFQQLTADPPDPNAEKRLAQLKRFARQFTATSRDKEGKQWELRLLPRPLYRYGDEESGGDRETGTGKRAEGTRDLGLGTAKGATPTPQSAIRNPQSPSAGSRFPVPDSRLLDGAVLGFVQGTDLEVVLVIEAHRGAKDAKSTWRYALARMSDLPLSVSLSGKEVWSVEAAKFDQASSGYYCGTVERYEKPPE